MNAASRLAPNVHLTDAMKPYVVTESGASEEIGKSSRFQLGKNYRATVKLTANARLFRSRLGSGFEKVPVVAPAGSESRVRHQPLAREFGLEVQKGEFK